MGGHGVGLGSSARTVDIATSIITYLLLIPWYAQADGDLFSWLKAHAAGLEVEVFDPNVWVGQVQGINALKVLEAASDGAYLERVLTRNRFPIMLHS